MKRFFSVFLIVLICSMSIFSASAGTSSTVTKQQKPITIMISFYDNIVQDHIIENTKIPLSHEIPIIQTIELLKEKELIKDYTLVDNVLTYVKFSDDSVKQAETDSIPTEFTVKQNGNYVTQGLDTVTIKDGDIIEWIYSTQAKTAAADKIASSVNTISKYGNENWNEKTNDALNQATNWLHLNGNDDASYLISMGIAGRTADIKAVNDFVDGVKAKKEYSTPMEMAKYVMALTFCGYDASLEDYNNLVKQLSNYADIMESGIFGAVNTLIAYDTNQYQLLIGAVNTRDTLVHAILEYQQADGGFSIMKNSSSDIDTTAMALTALAAYREEAAVEEAIENGLQFLSEQQTAKGGFGYHGQENLESLCTVIIALNSLSISLDDERFQKTSQSLVDQLLLYQNSDGGFAHVIGEKSAVMPTEQAMIALTSIKRNGNPYVVSIPIMQNKGNPTVHVAVAKDNAFLFIFLGSVLLFVAVCAIIITKGYVAKKK